jgi:hypothetical protein
LSMRDWKNEASTVAFFDDLSLINPKLLEPHAVSSYLAHVVVATTKLLAR